MDYKNGKIYKLVNDELGLTYYGSTCTELRKRLWAHKTQAKDKKYSSYKLFESGICKIYLVEKVSCEDKDELRQRERFYIENNECVNKNIPCRTKKEYHLANKEHLKQKSKEYHLANKEKIKQQIKEYHLANKEKIKEQRKEHYEANKEKLAQYQKQYHLQKKAQAKEVYDFLTQIETSNTQ